MIEVSPDERNFAAGVLTSMEFTPTDGLISEFLENYRLVPYIWDADDYALHILQVYPMRHKAEANGHQGAIACLAAVQWRMIEFELRTDAPIFVDEFAPKLRRKLHS